MLSDAQLTSTLLFNSLLSQASNTVPEAMNLNLKLTPFMLPPSGGFVDLFVRQLRLIRGKKNFKTATLIFLPEKDD